MKASSWWYILQNFRVQYILVLYCRLVKESTNSTNLDFNHFDFQSFTFCFSYVYTKVFCSINKPRLLNKQTNVGRTRYTQLYLHYGMNKYSLEKTGLVCIYYIINMEITKKTRYIRRQSENFKNICWSLKIEVKILARLFSIF